MHRLKLTNTLSKQKEFFAPVDPETVYVYVCGITPYDSTHIGHARSYINFDVLIRTLQFLGHKTVYIRNYTDIDDKLLDKARAAGNEMGYKEIAEKYIADFQLQMSRLSCQSPTVEPRATEYIEEMIAMIGILLEKGKAYILGDDVYFDITTFKEYGKLSGRNIDELMAGARIGVDEKKKNPGDFVLWKGNSLNKFWKAPFGYGRPGWHIECSAMVDKNCHNRSLDIHGGGYDLIFPHHENEIAQSESATGHALANCWIHNAFVKIGNEKMSKSLGNSLALDKLFQHTNPMVFRFYVLQHIYLTPLEFCPESLAGAQKPFERLQRLFSQTPVKSQFSISLIQDSADLGVEQKQFFDQISGLILDDLNASAVLGLIFKNFEKISFWSQESKSLLASFIFHVLGLDLWCSSEKEKNGELPSEIAELILKRDQARKDKDFQLADQIRAQLKELGFDVSDKKI